MEKEPSEKKELVDFAAHFKQICIEKSVPEDPSDRRYKTAFEIQTEKAFMSSALIKKKYSRLASFRSSVKKFLKNSASPAPDVSNHVKPKKDFFGQWWLPDYDFSDKDLLKQIFFGEVEEPNYY